MAELELFSHSEQPEVGKRKHQGSTKIIFYYGLESEASAKLTPEKSGKTELSTNAILSDITGQIRRAAPEWDKIKEGYQGYPRRDYNRGEKKGYFAEIYLHNELQKASEAYGDRVRIDVIPDESETENFIFEKKPGGNILVTDKLTKQHFVEYDAITEIDNIVVVWEMKNCHFKVNQQKNEKPFKSKRVKQIFAPLEEYFDNDTNFGYVVIVRSEVIDSSSDTQNEFRKNGGMIVPLKQSAVELFNAKSLETGK
jgi:hypothetical protein